MLAVLCDHLAVRFEPVCLYRENELRRNAGELWTDMPALSEPSDLTVQSMVERRR